jgi:hypothetical protein
MSEVEQFDVDQDEKDKEEEEQFIAVEDDPEGEEADEQDDQEDEDEEGETRLGGGRDEDEGKKGRRRYKSSSERNASRRRAKERTDREMSFLRGRNETLERRFSELEANVDARVTGSEISGIDQNISKAKSDLQLANQVIAQAVEKNDGQNLAEAMDHRDVIRDNLRDLEGAKDYLTDEGNRRIERPPMELDPRHVAHAQSFMIDNDWWDPRGQDDDSKSVLHIDGALVQEGYDPTSKDYWDELRERVQKELPHHFDAGDEEDDDDDDKGSGNGKGKRQTRRNKGPTFRTGGRERTLKDNEVYISPERKDAMIEAGIWDDPEARNSMLKRYAQYDAEAKSEANAR